VVALQKQLWQQPRRMCRRKRGAPIQRDQHEQQGEGKQRVADDHARCARRPDAGPPSIKTAAANVIAGVDHPMRQPTMARAKLPISRCVNTITSNTVIDGVGSSHAQTRKDGERSVIADRQRSMEHALPFYRRIGRRDLSSASVSLRRMLLRARSITSQPPIAIGVPAAKRAVRRVDQPKRPEPTRSLAAVTGAQSHWCDRSHNSCSRLTTRAPRKPGTGPGDVPKGEAV
jgi:hypothetical protein